MCACIPGHPSDQGGLPSPALYARGAEVNSRHPGVEDVLVRGLSTARRPPRPDQQNHTAFLLSQPAPY